MLTGEDWQRVKELFDGAVQRQPAERSRWLAGVCDQPAIRSEVESLLAAHDQAGDFIQQPLAAAAAIAALAPNSRSGQMLGPWRLVEEIGRGGMGTVWRAERADGVFAKTVAIKLVSRGFETGQLQHRFQHERQILASLSHPNITALLDGGSTPDGLPYFVMEYVEGKPITTFCRERTLPLRARLELFCTACDAVAYAHRNRVLHRDLKPSNILVTADGIPKLLDFGIAELLSANVPGESTGPSAPVSILTPDYASPEQVRAEPLTETSDIYSLGVILYELITGRHPYTLASASRDDMVSVVCTQQPLFPSKAAPRSEVDRDLDGVTMLALEKGPRDRYDSVLALTSDLRLYLAGEPVRAVGQTPRLRFQKLIRRYARWVAPLLLFAGLLGLTAKRFMNRPPAPPARFAIHPLPKTSFASPSSLAISPDGARLAYVGAAGDVRQVYVRSRDSLSARAIPGTEDARAPFWSPDGRFIGFFANRKLKKVDLSSGLVQTICDSVGASGGAWSPTGTIVFGAEHFGRLYRVPDRGGTPSPATSFDLARGEKLHAWPYFLPDGRHFVYYAGALFREKMGINVASLDSLDSRRLISAESNAVYAPPGYLLFAKGGIVFAQPFDAKRRSVTGDAVPVADGVRFDSTLSYASVASAPGDVLAYESGNLNTQLVWFDRTGKRLEPLAPPGEFSQFDLAPDGRRVAAAYKDVASGAYNIWLFDAAGGARRRVTARENRVPIWSPDGNRIVSTIPKEGRSGLYQQTVDEPQAEETLLAPGSGTSVPFDWSADGRFIVYHQQSPDPAVGISLWVLPLFGDRKPFPFLRARFNAPQAKLSPDGRWMAYTTSETGIDEVYVQPFPPTGVKWQVSSRGGMHPRWRRDGKELFYFDTVRKLVMGVEVRTDSIFQSGTPNVLFEAPDAALLFSRYPYAVTPDGQRFLVHTTVDAAEAQSIVFVLNWTSLLTRPSR